MTSARDLALATRLILNTEGVCMANHVFFRRMFTRIAVYISAILVFCGSSQTVSISGVVIDSLKQPLPGVAISLLKANLGSTTDASGKYVISGSGVVLTREHGSASFNGPQMAGGRLFLSVVHGSDEVTVMMLDTKGRTIERLYCGVPGAGMFSLGIKPRGELRVGQYLLKISIGSGSYNVKVLNMGNGTFSSPQKSISPESAGVSLSKPLSPVSDTLLCTKDTYFSSRTIIPIYAGAFDSVIMHAADIAGLKIADNEVAGWVQQENDAANNQVYPDSQYSQVIDGGYFYYYAMGIVTMRVQEMQKDTVKTFKAYVMDFGTNDKALQMFAKKRKDLDSTSGTELRG